MAIKAARSGMRSGGRFSARHAEPSKRSSPLDKLPMQDVWVRYQAKREETVRNYLMEKFLPLVRYNAERIHTRLPDEVDVEDLMSAGIFGLMDAIDAFDLERKVKFETYCAPRIRGAILDELRSMDWVPRLVRSRTGKVEQARQQIEKATGRAATDDEVAGKLNVSGEEFDKLKRDSSAVMTRSLSARTFASDSGREVREIDVIRDETQSNPLTEVQRRDLKDLMTKGLSRAERLIVILYYYEGMTMKEIGATLDLSESRVSQMHSSILARLKAQMQHRMRELEPVE
ncbi:RNA polymerase sigma factor FliA [Phycisphaerales bacterium]|nr:RNA polymerase sigma factor FliA [Phycisphaerales bacterium]